MAGRTVEIALGGQTRRLLFTPHAASVATRSLISLNRLEKNQTHNDAADLVRRGDIDAIATLVIAGLMHVDQRLTGETVYKWLDEVFREDRADEVRDAVLDGMKAGNLIAVGANRMADEAPGARPTIPAATGG